ncbi:MAG: ARMT1-like domain-containing protein [Candidatus Micrarchaeia archaeon]
MKIYPYCAACMFDRVLKTAELGTKDKEKIRKVVLEMCRLMEKEFSYEKTPSDLGTLQSMLVMRLTGNKDPYRMKKREAMEHAKKSYPVFEKYVSEGKTEFERFKRALMIAIYGNIAEVSSPRHSVNVSEIEKTIRRAVRSGLAIDDTREIYKKVLKARSILYICDNAGEAFFDKLLIKELAKRARVRVAVCTSPVDDDLTLKEAKQVRFPAEVFGKGSCFGFSKEFVNDEAWKKFLDADLVVAKGMANYETITEIPEARGKTAFLFTVKCISVSKNVGKPIGSGIAMLYK